MTLCKCCCGKEANWGDWVRGHWNRGKHHSVKTKQQLKNNAKNNPNYGMRGKHHSTATCNKISIIQKGKPLSKESILKRTATRKLNNVTPWNKGKILSEEDKKNYRKPFRKILSDVSRENYSKAHKGRPQSAEHRKNVSISIKEAAKNNPNFGMRGKHHTQETREKQSIKKIESLQNNISNTFIGKRGYVNNVYLRSSWEIAFALYLNDQNLLWDYEKTSFKLSNGKHYLPDFKVGQQFFEIKGYWTPTAKQKFELFKKEYPQILIKVLEYEQLKTILEKYKVQIEQITSTFKNTKQ